MLRAACWYFPSPAQLAPAQLAHFVRAAAMFFAGPWQPCRLAPRCASAYPPQAGLLIKDTEPYLETMRFA